MSSDPAETEVDIQFYEALVNRSFASHAELQREERSRQAESALLTQGVHDEGNAQCVLLRYPNRFLHNDAFGWLHWTDSHWSLEGAEAVLDRAVVETLEARILAALKSGAADKYAELIKRSIPNNSRVQAAKALFTSLAYVPPNRFDNEPDLLNCRNGVVDLRTGELFDHAPAHYLLHCAHSDYLPNAASQHWRLWLAEAVGVEAANWLQLAVGYSLTGYTREEVLFYLYGPPRSGKGTFTETLLALLGAPLCKEVNFATFTAQRTGDSQNFDLAPLKPCRVVIASESNSYERFNEAKLKALTGGNEIYCAFKHKTHFNFRPQFKIWLASNQPVNADPDDDAVWGRLRLVEFPHSHLGSENKLLKEGMRSPAVLEGVLSWAVEGARRWYALGGAGLPELPGSLRLKQAQRETLDNVAAWIEECCELGDHQFTPSADLYISYSVWCQVNGVAAKQSKGLSQALKRKRFLDKLVKIQGQPKRGFYGIKLR